MIVASVADPRQHRRGQLGIAWKVANWQCAPQQISFAVLSTGGSSWAIAVTYEDPSGVFPSPNGSTPTSFTLLAGSSNQFVTVGASMLPATSSTSMFLPALAQKRRLSRCRLGSDDDRTGDRHRCRPRCVGAAEPLPNSRLQRAVPMSALP
jgi:hypothetical protein